MASGNRVRLCFCPARYSVSLLCSGGIGGRVVGEGHHWCLDGRGNRRTCWCQPLISLSSTVALNRLPHWEHRNARRRIITYRNRLIRERVSANEAKGPQLTHFDSISVTHVFRVATQALPTSSEVVRHRSMVSDIVSLLLMECNLRNADETTLDHCPQRAVKQFDDKRLTGGN